MDIEAKLKLAERINTLRAELAAAEAEFAGVARSSPKGPTPKGRGRPMGPSVSQRVLNLVQESGKGGIARKDIIGIVGKAHESAVHSALKVHQRAGRLQSDGGVWRAKSGAVRAQAHIPGMEHPA